jgi:hypothetical protein
MTTARLLAAAAAAALATAASAAGPFDQFKGKVKEGLYEYRIENDMSGVAGLPPGMGKQTMTLQQCVTDKDIGSGGLGRKDTMPEGCEVRDFKMSGNSATYTMDCKGDLAMRSDTRISFGGDGFTMAAKTAMTQGGQTMNVAQKIDAKFIGPCKK